MLFRSSGNLSLALNNSTLQNYSGQNLQLNYNDYSSANDTSGVLEAGGAGGADVNSFSTSFYFVGDAPTINSASYDDTKTAISLSFNGGTVTTSNTQNLLNQFTISTDASGLNIINNAITNISDDNVNSSNSASGISNIFAYINKSALNNANISSGDTLYINYNNGSDASGGSTASTSTGLLENKGGADVDSFSK